MEAAGSCRPRGREYAGIDYRKVTECDFLIYSHSLAVIPLTPSGSKIGSAPVVSCSMRKSG